MNELIIPIITALFGGTGVVSFIAAKRERKAQVQVTEASALQEMQKSYAQFVLDNEKVIDGFRKELSEVKSELQQYKKQCGACSNNKIKS